MKEDEGDSGDDIFTLKGRQSHLLSRKASLKAQGVERVYTGSDCLREGSGPGKMSLL